MYSRKKVGLFYIPLSIDPSRLARSSHYATDRSGMGQWASDHHAGTALESEETNLDA